jgi:ATP-dependent DNA helicase RecG
MQRAINIPDYLQSSVKILPGVGEKTYEALLRIGCSKIVDLLFHFPSKAIFKKFNPNLLLMPSGTDVVKVVTIREVILRQPRNKVNRIICDDGDCSINLIYFYKIPKYFLDLLKPDRKVVVSGKIERDFKGEIQIIHPKIYHDISKVSKVDVIYPITYNLTSFKLHNLINVIISKTSGVIFPEWLNKEFLAEKAWSGWLQSLDAIHNPKSESDISLYSIHRQRIVFDEFLASQIAIRQSRKERDIYEKGEALACKGLMIQRLLDAINFTLTPGQEEVIAEIIKDQRSQKRMMRLLQGDVGSGKTLVALCAMLNAVDSGKQAVLMAPTDILANQHFESISKFLANFDIKLALLTGKITQAKRKPILAEIVKGEADIVIGTHAVFQDKVQFNDLALIVIDEQHRFGVQQRIALMNKGPKADVLVMSATPIPRSLSLTIYGDMDISTLQGKPVGRIPISTYTVLDSKIDQVVTLIRNKISQGEQVYWICPLIEGTSEEEDELDNNAAAKVRYEIIKKIFGNNVGLLHGRLKIAEKERVMENFAEGKIKVLVATTVVEVGIDVKDATLLIIEQAEKFGLAQLHQLRGRVGRGAKSSECILLFSNNIGQVSRQRLHIMKNSEDGFYIAEEDLKLRGGGDILGNKQSGLPVFKTASLEYHHQLLLEASKYANKIVDKNDNLSALLQLFGYDSKINFALV